MRYQTMANVIVAKKLPNDMVHVDVAHARLSVPAASATRLPSPVSIYRRESPTQRLVIMSANPTINHTMVKPIAPFQCP